MSEPWLDMSALRLQAEEAKQAYLDNLDPVLLRQLWHDTLDMVGKDFQSRLEDAFRSDQLADTISRSGSITELLRQLTAPPLSQDQFKLLCPTWSKQSEKSDRAVRPVVSREIASVIQKWIDPRLMSGIDAGRFAEVAAGPIYILARQKYETDRRTAASRAQELAVIQRIESMGYHKSPSREIDQPWTVGEGRYMHKTTFCGSTKSTAEVDIAVGLRNGRLLAIECKVSNDATNSIKRVNDVLKKRESWERGYGQVLTTGAVLQGVIAAKDVLRLAQSGVCVFFSHDLSTLESFLACQ